MGEEERDSLRFLLAAVIARWQRERVEKREGCKARKTWRGRYNTACFFLFFVKALAPSECLSHANKACLKLIELTEAASETKTGRRWKRGEKGVRTGRRKTHYNPVFCDI